MIIQQWNCITTEQFPHRLYSFFCNFGAILTFPQFSQLYSCADDSNLDTTLLLAFLNRIRTAVGYCFWNNIYFQIFGNFTGEKGLTTEELLCPSPKTFHFSIKPPIRIFSCIHGESNFYFWVVNWVCFYCEQLYCLSLYANYITNIQKKWKC